MNKQTKLLTAVLAVGSLLLLSGCANYKAMSLPQLAQHSDKFEKKNVSLEYKIFTKVDCQEYLGRKKLLKKGYQPVQLTITNNTNRSYTYSASSLSLPIVPAELVAKKVKFSTAGRIIGYSAAAAGFVTLAACAFSITGALIPAACKVGFAIMIPSGYLATGFSLAALADGIKSGKANKELTVDFATKAFLLNGIIRPYQTINGIVFVPKKSFNTNFTFTLNDADTNKTVVLNSRSENIDVK